MEIPKHSWQERQLKKDMFKSFYREQYVFQLKECDIVICLVVLIDGWCIVWLLNAWLIVCLLAGLIDWLIWMSHCDSLNWIDWLIGWQLLLIFVVPCLTAHWVGQPWIPMAYGSQGQIEEECGSRFETVSRTRGTPLDPLNHLVKYRGFVAFTEATTRWGDFSKDYTMVKYSDVWERMLTWKWWSWCDSIWEISGFPESVGKNMVDTHEIMIWLQKHDSWHRIQHVPTWHHLKKMTQE